MKWVEFLTKENVTDCLVLPLGDWTRISPRTGINPGEELIETPQRSTQNYPASKGRDTGHI